jgi:hypothetical protein
MDSFIGAMTGGLGSLQRQALAALRQRADHDSYRAEDATHLSGGRCLLRARWRWYTTAMIGLVDECSTETKRATANQAIRTLAHRGWIQVRMGDYPYCAPFAGYRNEIGQYAGKVNLAELHGIDSRWPLRHGRRLWFRLPPPPWRAIPVDDRIAVLDHLDAHRPDEFEDFVSALDRRHAWNSPNACMSGEHNQFGYFAGVVCGQVFDNLVQDRHAGDSRAVVGDA